MEAYMNFVVLFPFIGAAVTWIFGRRGERARNVAAAVTVSLELIAALVLTVQFFMADAAFLGDVSGMVCWEGVCGLGFSFTADSFRILYVLIAAFMWFVSTLFSFSYMKHYENQNRYYLFLLLTLGATVGIFLSADFFTMFVFFELMSFASYVWVAQDERKESLRAAETYLAIAVIGGLCILMGMFLLYQETGSLATTGNVVNAMWINRPNGRIVAAGILMLIGFGAKAGAVPLHIWLPKAHPVAPAPASALLSGILTKTGVFGTMILTLQIFGGNTAFGKLILGIGILTMLTGAVLAVFSVDLKRTLACSSVSQIGFIFTGLGMAGMFSGIPEQLAIRDFSGWMTVWNEGGEVSLNGAILHMVNHSLIKLLLFCVAGVIFMNLHKLDLNEIRGYGRKKPLLHILFLAGALGIAGVPLFNGYVSKSMIHEGMVLWQEELPSVWMRGAEWLFLLSGGLTVAYMTKLYVAIFLECNVSQELQEKYDGQKNYCDKVTAILLSLTALLLPVIGVYGGIDKGTFNWEGLSGALISIVIGVAVYFVFVRKWMMRDGIYVNRWRAELDLEERVYRPLLSLLDVLLSAVCRFLDRLPDYLVVGLRKTVYKDSPLPHELEEGDALTHAVGTLLDDGKEALNHTIYKKHPIQGSAEHRLAMISQEIKENNTMISRSLSFGLLLFCIGLLFTLIYMLVI